MDIIPEKAPQEQEKPKVGLFGNLSSGTGAGLFANQQKTETSAGGLFGNQQKAETTPAVTTQIQEEKPKGLFGGFTSNQPKTETPAGGLFGNQQKAETKTEAPVEKPKGIFGN